MKNIDKIYNCFLLGMCILEGISMNRIQPFAFTFQQQKRKDIMNGKELNNWMKMKSQDGFWTKVPIETRIEIVNWIKKHPNVIPSPIQDDTLLVPNPIPGGRPKKIPMAKLLLQVPVRELHNDLYCPTIGLGDSVVDELGNPLVSNTVFRALLPPE